MLFYFARIQVVAHTSWLWYLFRCCGLCCIEVAFRTPYRNQKLGEICQSCMVLAVQFRLIGFIRQ